MKYSDKMTGLKEIQHQYDAFIVDIWGVVYDGINAYKGVIDSLNSIINSDKPLLFLSNVPRPSDVTKQKLIELGLNMNKAKIYSSGDLCIEQLKIWNHKDLINLGKKFYHLGEARNKDILSGLDLSSEDDIKDVDFILLTVYVDEDENLNQYDELLAEAHSLKLPIICANPDISVLHGNKKRYCAGYFAKKYQELGGVVYYYGKPDNKIFNKAFSILANNRDLDKKKILMIGDTMETDIFGANNSGIDSLLVLTGNGKDIAENFDLLDGYDYKPSWIANSV
jgi:HAD superfamily hydrolase (TIGR01459 family)